jgi:hypothetical protein
MADAHEQTLAHLRLLASSPGFFYLKGYTSNELGRLDTSRLFKPDTTRVQEASSLPLRWSNTLDQPALS